MTRRRRTRAAPIDERAFHRWIASHLPAGRIGPLPIGDDAAALTPPYGSVAVLTVDSLVEGTHFLSDSPPRAVGAAAAGVSLSDAACKGARPAGILLALLLPPGTPQRWAEDVLRGAESAGAPFGAHLIGGDTKPSPTRTVVSTVVGWGRTGALAPRGGARPGDLLLTTGTVGRGGSAWLRWRDRRPGLRRAGLLAMLEVRPRVREGIALAPFAHAMIDTSDGIADSTALMSRASRVRAILELDRLPWDRSIAPLGPMARQRAGFFGGDYELLIALPPTRLLPAAAAVADVGGSLTIVGRVEAGHGALLETAAGRTPLPHAGWKPFALSLSRGRATPSQRR